MKGAPTNVEVPTSEGTARKGVIINSGAKMATDRTPSANAPSQPKTADFQEILGPKTFDGKFFRAEVPPLRGVFGPILPVAPERNILLTRPDA